MSQKLLAANQNELPRVITPIKKPRKIAVFIPTHLPADDPRDFSTRSIARFTVGMEYARRLRADYGRANVIVVVFGGWPLYNRLPLAVHHVFAATAIHNLLEPHELDFVASYGVNSVTDLHGTLSWLDGNLLQTQDAYLVTSTGHAERVAAESDMSSLFENIYHVESAETRGDEDEDDRWSRRALDIPPYQYIVGGRASDVTRFGSQASLLHAHKMEEWALKNPKLYTKYIADIWRFMQSLEASNVIVRCHTPGCWRITINC